MDQFAKQCEVNLDLKKQVFPSNFREKIEFFRVLIGSILQSAIKFKIDTKKNIVQKVCSLATSGLPEKKVDIN